MDLMRKADEIICQDDFEEMMVVAEAAILLGVKTGRIHAMIEVGVLPSRFATRPEIAQLLTTGRVKGVPGSGIRLVPRFAVNMAQNRSGRGWRKGRPRKS
ncbi:hypothetical protein [Ktedonospora formicarum]|uniref:Uncharacterized protein n=1 Tax=Ktedonospora formicarum TaxID=2778364 RepID=A0A8J3I408_9CHLR|nr:hypothetical protein [Ktedonospora formicarum]GHO46448.1 hypothetical protein KSX_46110 [Ktedonospora formicarum]